MVSRSHGERVPVVWGSVRRHLVVPIVHCPMGTLLADACEETDHRSNLQASWDFSAGSGSFPVSCNDVRLFVDILLRIKHSRLFCFSKI